MFYLIYIFLVFLENVRAREKKLKVMTEIKIELNEEFAAHLSKYFPPKKCLMGSILRFDKLTKLD